MVKKVAVGQTIVNADSLTQERDENNFYPTPVAFLEWLFPYLTDNKLIPIIRLGGTILDVGTGTGNWGNTLYSLYGIRSSGVELYSQRYVQSKFPGYKYLFQANIIDWTAQADIVMGNPPYTKGKKNDDSLPSTTEIVIHCVEKICKPTGTVFFLLPTNFRHGATRTKELRIPTEIVDLSNRINFQSEDGKGGSYPGEYAIFIWDRNRQNTNFYRGFRAIWK